ncbi:MAG: hypothetical protein KBC50_02255 [Candidatus Pacebacteria bacterium]|nr:hypothetical protein [Candidatus Paceibacterota bacterium]
MKNLFLAAAIALSAASTAAQTTFAGTAAPAMSEVMTIMTPGGVMITISTIREYRPPNIVYQVPEYRPAAPMVYENLPPTFSYSKPEPRKSLRCDPCSVTTPKN